MTPTALSLALRLETVWGWLLARLLNLMSEARGAPLKPSPHLLTCGGGDAPCSASPPLYFAEGTSVVDDPRHGPRLTSSLLLMASASRHTLHLLLPASRFLNHALRRSRSVVRETSLEAARARTLEQTTRTEEGLVGVRIVLRHLSASAMMLDVRRLFAGPAVASRVQLLRDQLLPPPTRLTPRTLAAPPHHLPQSHERIDVGAGAR